MSGPALKIYNLQMNIGNQREENRSQERKERGSCVGMPLPQLTHILMLVHVCIDIAPLFKAFS